MVILHLNILSKSELYLKLYKENVTMYFLIILIFVRTTYYYKTIVLKIKISSFFDKKTKMLSIINHT